MTIDIPAKTVAGLAQFTGRRWVLSALLDWLGQSESRLFLLRGNPGTGKSTFIAWLLSGGSPTVAPHTQQQLATIQSRVKAAFFCDADSAEWAPHSFAVEVGEQLARNVPGFDDARAKALADLARIDNKITIGTMEAGARVYGVQLLESSDDASADRHLLHPLRLLAKQGHREPILLVVDALDEAEAYRGTRSIAELLDKILRLPLPIWVVATSRADPRVLKYLDRPRVVDLKTDAPAGTDDVRAFISPRLNGLPSEERDRLSELIATQADGNFLVADLGVNEVLKAVQRGEGTTSLTFSASAGDYYLRFLRRELGRDEWQKVYKLLLGLIVAGLGSGLDSAQLRAISQLDDIDGPLELCAPYLKGNLPDGPFQPFHKTFADFLTGEDGGPAHAFRVDARAMHRRIARAYMGSRRLRMANHYAARHLSSHLYRAREDQDLWRLIDRQAWYTSQMEFTPSGRAYLNDLALAWELAESADTRAAALETNLPVLAREVRCALATASLHSLSSATPVELLIAMVATGRWEAGEALEIALQDPRPIERAEALMALADVLPTGARGVTLKAAIESVSLIAFPMIHERERVMIALARKAAALGHPREALDVARKLPFKERAAVLRELVLADPPLVNREEAVREVLATVSAFPGGSFYNRQEIETSLSELTPLLAGGLLQEAIDMAFEMYRIAPEVILKLICQLPEADERLPYLRKLLNRATPGPAQSAETNLLERIMRAGELDQKASILRLLDPVLPEELRKGARMLARAVREACLAVDDMEDRASGLTTLLKVTPHAERPELLRSALGAAREITYPQSRARVLRGLAPYVPQADRPSIVAVLLRTIRAIESPREKAELLKDLAASSAASPREALLAEAFDTARAIQNHQERVKELASLASDLPNGPWDVVMAEVEAIEEGGERVEVLKALADVVPEAVVGRAVEVACQIEDLSRRVDALMALATAHPAMRIEPVFDAVLADRWHTWTFAKQLLELTRTGLLTPMQVNVVVREVTAIVDPPACRLWALASLAPLVPEPRRSGLLRLALASKAIRDSDACHDARQLLTPYLPEPARDEALRIALAEALDGLPNSAWKVRRLVCQLPGDLRDEALCTTMDALNRDETDREFADLVEQFAAEMGPRAVQNAIKQYWYLPMKHVTRALTALVAKMQTEELRDAAMQMALQALGGISSRDDYIEAAVELLPYLDEANRDKTLEIALEFLKEITDPVVKANAIALLLPWLPKASQGQAIDIILNWIKGDHSSLTQKFRANRSGNQSAELTVLSLLAPSLSPGQRDNVLRQVLDGLSPDQSLPEELDGSEELRFLVDDADQAWATAVSMFACHLSDEARQNMLTAARLVSPPEARALALSGLIPFLSGASQAEALRAALDVLSKVWDSDLRVRVVLKLFSACFAFGLVTDEVLTLDLVHRTCLEVVATPESRRRLNTLESIAPHLARLLAKALHPLWCEMLRTLARRERAHLVCDIAALAPVLVALSGPTVIKRVTSTIEKVEEWWP